MQDFRPAYFFDLSTFRHGLLFDANAYVWKALERLDSYLHSLELGKIEVPIPQGAFLVDAHLISIGKGSVIEPGAYIKGPCYLGNNCTVRHGAYIRGNLLAGDRCVIGHDSEVKQAILLDGAHAAHFAYVGDSILGNKVNLGAGTKCANLKFNNEQILISDGKGFIETGLRKFGAIVGDGTQIGCNSVTNPGTLVGQDVWCYPSVNVGGFIPSSSIVKNLSEVSVTPKKENNKRPRFL